MSVYVPATLRLRQYCKTHPERLKIPILVFVQLGVNLSPTHWIFNNFEVIGYIGFRHWVPKIIVPVNAIIEECKNHN